MKIGYRLALAILAVGFIASSAPAQDFYWTSASARSLSLGGVYVPSSGDAVGALASNPAGLSSLGGPSLNLSVTTVFARGSFSNSANTDSPLRDSPGALPYGGFGMPIGHSRFSFGVGFVPDLMSVSNWRYVDPRGAGGVTYGLQEQKSAILAGRAIAGFSASFGPKLSIGATFGSDYNSNTLIAPYIFQSQPTLKGLKTLLNLNTSGVGWNTSVGIRTQLSRKAEVGLAWKSRTKIDSTGTATGDAYALFGVPQGSPASTFAYSADVRNVLPQSVLASVNWQATSRWVLAFQTDWVNWGDAFVNLPVTLTNGTNAGINSVVGSSTLIDGVPLNWKDQYGFHAGAERVLTESASLRFGYAYANNPVPSSTLSPLTAAIMSNQISAGFVYQKGRSGFEGAYSFDPTAQESVQQSGLLSGEYNNSTVHIGTQNLTASYSFRF
jgi:long-subunit fatty acid transport protein